MLQERLTPQRGNRTLLPKTLVCQYGEQKTYKYIEIDVTIMGKTYTILVCVASKLLCSMILGRHLPHFREVLAMFLGQNPKGEKGTETISEAGFAGQALEGLTPSVLDKILDLEQLDGSRQFQLEQTKKKGSRMLSRRDVPSVMM